MKRETSGPELARLVAVLDALIKWSTARPRALSFRDDDTPSVLSFECVGSKMLCWSARVTRGDAPTLEFYPPSGRALSPEARARMVEILNRHSRDGVGENGRLRIGFGALKNAGAFEALTALLAETLTPPAQPASAAS